MPDLVMGKEWREVSYHVWRNRDDSLSEFEKKFENQSYWRVGAEEHWFLRIEPKPLPEVRVGDVIRWYYSDSYTDTDKQGSSELDTVLSVTGDRITFTDGGFIWRNHTRVVEPSQPYEVYRKVEN